VEKQTRNAIEGATQRARGILEKDFTEQLQGDYDVMHEGRVEERPGAHLTGAQRALRARIVAAIEHKRAQGMTPKEAVADYLRDAAFTTVNRFVTMKMLEARGLVQECVSKGEASSGFANEFCGLAPGLKFPDGSGYRIYIESIFDELSTEVKVLFDRRDPASALWPRKVAFDGLLSTLNSDDLKAVWGEDETIGWVYQYFNSSDERREMRESHAPQNNRELAVRNQFFTPRYVVEFLVQNTIGILWIEMNGGSSELASLPFVVQRGLVKHRQRKDPRDIRVLDPACGSGHFLLCAFDAFTSIYREAWASESSTFFSSSGNSLRADYPTLESLKRALPCLILEHNLFGIDIDPRCSQIAALSLWMRAQKFWGTASIPREDRPVIRRTNVIIAEPIPADKRVRDAFVSSLEPRLGQVAEDMFRRLELAGEDGSLLDINDWVRSEIRKVFGDDGELFTEADEEKWRSAEAALLKKLAEFAAKANDSEEWSRSLFADDASRGLAFIEVMRGQFDVVLMNPPFGDVTPRARDACGVELSVAANDIGGAFVLAAKRRWAPHGCIGVLASTTLWFKPSVVQWRKQSLLAKGHGVRLAAHLGGDVLDGATVSASATVLDIIEDDEQATFLRLILYSKARRTAPIYWTIGTASGR
jgi:hypothetical protein